MRPYALIDLHCDTLTDCMYAGSNIIDTLDDPARTLSLTSIPNDVRWAQFFAVNFGVDELNKSIFVIGGDIFRAVAVIQADENAAHHANLGAGKAKTVSIHQGILHIIQQSGKAVIKFGNGAADLFQDGVTIFYDCTKSHNKNPP